MINTIAQSLVNGFRLVGTSKGLVEGETLTCEKIDLACSADLTGSSGMDSCAICRASLGF